MQGGACLSRNIMNTSRNKGNLRSAVALVSLTACVCLLVHLQIGNWFTDKGLRLRVKRHGGFPESPFVRKPGLQAPRGRYGIYVMSTYGRLGNQLFEYSALYAMAKRTNRTAIFACSPSDDPRRAFRRLPMKRVALNHMKVKRFPVRREVGYAIYSPDLWKDLPNRSVEVCCLFQSYKYFRGFEEDIRQMFEFNSLILAKADGFLHGVKQSTRLLHGPGSPVTYVGVHVRRGDMLASEGQQFGFRVPAASYFHKAANYYRKRYRNIAFVVASNDMGWCQQQFAGVRDFYFALSYSAVEHMAILSRCNHTVMSVGTYGWWSGFLAGGEVVYYKDMFTPGSYMESVTHMDDFIPPLWIGMKD